MRPEARFCFYVSPEKKRNSLPVIGEPYKAKYLALPKRRQNDFRRKDYPARIFIYQLWDQHSGLWVKTGL